MHSFLDAKFMAKTLRQLLAERGWPLSHGESLELVARQFGVPNWNVLAARIDAARSDAPDSELPRGWRPSAQTDERLFRIGVDPAVPGAAFVESRYARSSGVDVRHEFATCMQSISAERFRGKRLHLAAELRTEDVDRGSLWMRVDNVPGQAASFDNMYDRSKQGVLEGTVGWTSRSIVLPVGTDAASIHFGFLLKGFGRLWARGFRLEVAGEDLPSTAIWSNLEAEPQNLDFGRP